MAEHKADPKLLRTPVEYLCGDPEAHEEEASGGTFNGEPDLPKRTETRFGVPEKVRDTEGDLPARKG